MASITVRALRREIQQAGGTLVRKGAHEIWQMPNGERVPVSTTRSEAPLTFYGNTLKALERAGVDLRARMRGGK